MEPKAIRVLLIDDDEQDFSKTEAALAQLDGQPFHLDWTATFREGKRALEADDYDVYLLDYILDEKTGLDMLRELRRGALQAPVIMLTGKGSFSVDVEAMQLGVADYLDKEKSDPELLERTIRYALERKATERALHESEERLRSMFDHLPIGLFRCTREGGFIDANAALVRLLGYPSSTSLREAYAPGFYVNPKDRSRFLETLDRLGVVQGFETEMGGRDGRTLKLRTTARVHRDAYGRVAYVEGAVEDVTDAWPTVGFYLDAARFQRMFRAGPLGLITVGPDGLIQDANPSFLLAAGHEVGELIQTPFADLWCDEDQTMMRAEFADIGAGPDDRALGSRRFRHRRGHLLPTQVSLAVIRDWDDNPQQVLVMLDAFDKKAALP